jgi:ABC-type bacteriocin/lantibiotic exporter with double-glycine peptidase domain
VHYRYPPSRAGASVQDVLRGVCLEVGDGESLAIVGEVGSGKSTLALLVAGLLAPTSGTVQVVPRSWARPDRPACLVDNQDFLFSRSIAENLRMVDPTLTLRGMVRICQTVGVHRHITALPQGYDSVIGERGLRLSSGQRQLLALARAVAARPTVLILDEATTCLDADAERTAIAGVRRSHAGPVILIAHRMSSVLLADRVVVLGDGKILGTGTHEELLSGSDAYRTFYQLQRI